jgi:carbon storage regulator
MLILTRKLNEEIRLNSEITIKVLGISEGQVKLGITAPEEVKIFRGEIYEKVKQSTIEASAQSKNKLRDITMLKVNKLKESNNAE